jgi:cell wall-associated NlpC family hydrolase
MEEKTPDDSAGVRASPHKKARNIDAAINEKLKTYRKTGKKEDRTGEEAGKTFTKEEKSLIYDSETVSGNEIKKQDGKRKVRLDRYVSEAAVASSGNSDDLQKNYSDTQRNILIAEVNAAGNKAKEYLKERNQEEKHEVKKKQTKHLSKQGSHIQRSEFESNEDKPTPQKLHHEDVNQGKRAKTSSVSVRNENGKKAVDGVDDIHTFTESVAKMDNNPANRHKLLKKFFKKRYAAQYRAKNGTGGESVGAAGAGGTAEAVGTDVSAGASSAGTTVESTAEAGAKTAGKGGLIGLIIIIVIIVIAVVFFITTLIYITNGQNALDQTMTYSASDDTLLVTNKYYGDMEDDLDATIKKTDQLKPGYDEYRYDLAKIEHNGNYIAAYFTAKYGNYSDLTDEMKAELKEIFAREYIVTYTPSEEPAKRLVQATDPITGEGLKNSDGTPAMVEQDYMKKIMTVKLVNNDLNQILLDRLDAGKIGYYNTLVTTSGQRPGLFGGDSAPDDQYSAKYKNTSSFDESSLALSTSDAKAMFDVGKDQLGKSYIMGAAHGSDFNSSNPAHFDCSSFVCWVLKNSGVANIGCRDTNGILGCCDRISASEAQPGDIIFFEHTYNYPGASHVGIYLGNGLMMHAGNPVKIATVNTNYWNSHFLTFGRIKTSMRN